MIIAAPYDYIFWGFLESVLLIVSGANSYPLSSLSNKGSFFQQHHTHSDILIEYNLLKYVTSMKKFNAHRGVAIGDLTTLNN